MTANATDYRRYVRPSFLPVLAACPAAAQVSAYIVDLFGEPEEDGAATIGTDIHAVVLLALMPLVETGEKPDVNAALARFPNMSGWDQACARRCVAFAMDLLRRTRADYPDEAVEVLLEHHLDGSVLGIDRGGTADLLIVVPFKRLIVVDWKCGFLDQGEAADHDSLASYGLMGAVTFKTPAVDVYLFQPRSEPALRASGASFDADALRTTATWTRSVVADATSDNPEVVPGLHCTKCRAIQRCPAAREFIMRVRELYENIGLPTDTKAWGELVTAAKVASKFSDDAMEQAKGHAIAGGGIDGWKLQPGGSARKIDHQQAVRLAQDAGVLHLLLEHVTVKTSAIDELPAIAPAVTSEPKSPSLRPVKASSVEAKA